MGWNGGFSPARHDSADDDQILKDYGKVGSTSVGGQHPVLFAHGVFPEHFSGLAIKALEYASETKNEHCIAGWIGNYARPADTFCRCVRQINVVDAFPNQLTGFCVQANRLFAFFFCLRERSAHKIHAIIHHHW